MTRYVSLDEYLVLAELVTGVDAEALSKTADLPAALLALGAPQATYDNVELRPALMEKGAVLLLRLIAHRPLNEHSGPVAWVALCYFFELNGVRWLSDPVAAGIAEALVGGIGLGLIVDEAHVASLLRLLTFTP